MKNYHNDYFKYNKNKTTILITSIILTAVLVMGTMSPAFAGNGLNTPFDQIPEECNANVASVRITCDAKAPVEADFFTGCDIDLDNRNDPNDPDENTCEVALASLLVTVNDDFECVFDFTDEDENNDSDPTDGGLTVPTNSFASNIARCEFDTSEVAPVNMLWNVVPYIAPGVCIV